MGNEMSGKKGLTAEEAAVLRTEYMDIVDGIREIGGRLEDCSADEHSPFEIVQRLNQAKDLLEEHRSATLRLASVVNANVGERNYGESFMDNLNRVIEDEYREAMNR